MPNATQASISERNPRNMNSVPAGSIPEYSGPWAITPFSPTDSYHSLRHAYRNRSDSGAWNGFSTPCPPAAPTPPIINTRRAATTTTDTASAAMPPPAAETFMYDRRDTPWHSAPSKKNHCHASAANTMIGNRNRSTSTLAAMPNHISCRCQRW